MGLALAQCTHRLHAGAELQGEERGQQNDHAQQHAGNDGVGS